MLATEAFAADRVSKIVEEISGMVARIEYRSSTIKGSTDHSTARMYDDLADCSNVAKREDSAHLDETQFQDYNSWGDLINSSHILK